MFLNLETFCFMCHSGFICDSFWDQIKVKTLACYFLHSCTRPNVGGESRSVMSDSLRPHGLYNPWNSPGQNTGMGSLSLFQGIFPTQRSNPDLPHCRQILYQLSYQGSPNIIYFQFYHCHFPQNYFLQMS